MECNNIDILYINGGDSKWKDQELIYSIRSVEMFLRNYGNIVIVGRKPEVLQNVIHIPHQDVFTNKARNIASKVYRACDDDRLTENILFLNDDYFFVKEVDAMNYPYVYKCNLDHTIRINQNDYGQHVKATVEALKNKNLNIKNFDTHKPIIFNRQKLKEVHQSYNWTTNSHGFILKSLYCNTLNIEGQFMLDNKINHPHLRDRWHKLIKTIPDMFSIGDMSLNMGFKEFLQEFYPNKSKYEI